MYNKTAKEFNSVKVAYRNIVIRTKTNTNLKSVLFKQFLGFEIVFRFYLAIKQVFVSVNKFL